MVVLGNEANDEQALAGPIGLGLGPRGFNLSSSSSPNAGKVRAMPKTEAVPKGMAV